MPSYIVTVATGMSSYIYITLVGTVGCSKKTMLHELMHHEGSRRQEDSYEMKVGEDLGQLLFVKIENNDFWFHDKQFCQYIKVKTPSEEHVEFPCYQWLVNHQEVVLRDGKARLPQDDDTLLKQQRQKELEMRQKSFRWTEWEPGFPMSILAQKHQDLPLDVQFDHDKAVDFEKDFALGIINLGIDELERKFQSSWKHFADFESIFHKIKDIQTEYAMQHWKEDFIFGYQLLNGCNPVLIQKCSKLPDKLPVTHEMVSSSLERNLTLEEEIKAGNIFICDYEMLDGISANSTDPYTKQYLAAPICLLYKNTENTILPIAIQLSQTPGTEHPIFLPSDAHYDWLLAKIWVRSSDFQIHETLTHLLRTHLMSEVFAIAMYRQLPAVHPVFKLLIPHVRFTMAINTRAREQLINKGGVFDNFLAVGGGGQAQLIRKAMKSLTFRSFCFPDMIRMRGMDNKEEVPNYFYRDDGNSVWEAIKSFVSEVVQIYYSSDERVQGDGEIQAFVKDVLISGMQDLDDCGFPKSLNTREELIEYLTVIVFNTSAQHAAVNFGQFDWFSWIPNAPCTMRQPPPNQKGVTTEDQIMKTLPDRGRSCWQLAVVWALSQFQDKEVYLGMCRNDYFTEKEVNGAVEKFRETLGKLTNTLQKRDEKKKIPYMYLHPNKIPNSIAV